MGNRPFTYFWAAVAAATVLLGSAVSQIRSEAIDHAGAATLFGLTAFALASALLIAGRILLAAAGTHRALRRRG